MRPRAALLLVVLTAPAFAQDTQRVSVGSAGQQADQECVRPALSGDGRWSAFESRATNLVAGDHNGACDVFVHDRTTGATVRASVDGAGHEGDGDSSFAALSADGRYVAFASQAANLVPGDANGRVDVFVRDLAAGTTLRASVPAGGGQADGDSIQCALSGDGARVAFVSWARNLVPGDTNLMPDVFVRDLATGATVRVSVSDSGAQADDGSETVAISTDGRCVAFASYAKNLVTGDTNLVEDVFVRDLAAGTTVRVSLRSTGGEIVGPSRAPALSSDGRCVAFVSAGPSVVPGDFLLYDDVFVRDTAAATTVAGSVSAAGALGFGHSAWPALSADGRFLAFESDAANLVPGDGNGATDVLVRDLVAGTTARASSVASGAAAAGASRGAALDASGLALVFASEAADLVAGDTNAASDVFARSTPAGVASYCTAKVNSQFCVPAIGWSGAPSLGDPAPFLITAADAINGKQGLLAYGFAPAAAPFQGGVLCVAPPLRRTALQGSGGSPPPLADCSGSFAFDFKAWMLGGADPALVPTAEVFAQYWYRDPLDFGGYGSGLTDAVRFIVLP